MKYLSRVLSHFWRRWRNEYLLSLRDCHRYYKGGEVARELAQGDIMLLRDDSKPRGFWSLVRIENLIRGADGLVRGATIRVPSRGKKTTILRRPVTHLYPLEINCSQEVEGDADKTLNRSKSNRDICSTFSAKRHTTFNQATRKGSSSEG